MKNHNHDTEVESKIWLISADVVRAQLYNWFWRGFHVTRRKLFSGFKCVVIDALRINFVQNCVNYLFSHNSTRETIISEEIYFVNVQR